MGRVGRWGREYIRGVGLRNGEQFARLTGKVDGRDVIGVIRNSKLINAVSRERMTFLLYSTIFSPTTLLLGKDAIFEQFTPLMTRYLQISHYPSPVPLT